MEQTPAERFAELYRTTHPEVLGFVARRLGSSGADSLHRAEDVTHEAFLIAWRKLDSVPLEKGAARAYLFTIARNCLLNDRRATVRREAFAVSIGDGLSQVSGAHQPGPEAGVLANQEITRAWSQLTADEQEALSLVAWEELTPTEAAKVLGISGTAFRSRLFRARASLRKAISPHPDDAKTPSRLNLTQLNLA